MVLSFTVQLDTQNVRDETKTTYILSKYDLFKKRTFS